MYDILLVLCVPVGPALLRIVCGGDLTANIMAKFYFCGKYLEIDGDVTVTNCFFHFQIELFFWGVSFMCMVSSLPVFLVALRAMRGRHVHMCWCYVLCYV